jgi:protein PhnA
MIKDLKRTGSSEVLEVAIKSRPIRLVDGDYEISCGMEGLSIGLKACFVKKVVALGEVNDAEIVSLEKI